jgi:uncharacterized protein YycO
MMLPPQPGDFEVVPMGGEGGKWIHIAQILNNSGGADYEHARLYLGNGNIVEAQPGGARIAPWRPVDNGLWSTGIIELTTEQRLNIVAAGRSFAGVPYSAVDYFAIAAKHFKLGPLVPGLKDYVESSKHMICSQLVDKAYQCAGVQLFDDKRWNGYVTPADLAGLLLKKR